MRAAAQDVLRPVEARLGEPGRVIGGQCSTVDNMVALVPDNVGVIPHFAPEIGNMCRGPAVEVQVGVEGETVLGIDTVLERMCRRGLDCLRGEEWWRGEFWRSASDAKGRMRRGRHGQEVGYPVPRIRKTPDTAVIHLRRPGIRPLAYAGSRDTRCGQRRERRELGGKPAQ